MENVNAWEKLASTLKEDPALEEKLRQTVDRMTQESGEAADARLVARAAESLGFSLPLGAIPLEDSALSYVAGGKSMSGKENAGFDFNTWLGELLRDLLRQDSDKVMAGRDIASPAGSPQPSGMAAVHAVPDPVPVPASSVNKIRPVKL